MQLDMAKPIEELKSEETGFKKILMAHGIPRGSGSHEDYEKAKAILERHDFLFSYDAAIKEICEYLEI